MRITNITVTNVQGLRNAALAVSEPLLLVSGDNGAGKSSLLDAISMAFTGQPRRVSLKKELDRLVTEGAKKGDAHVAYVDGTGEEQTAWMMLPGGKSVVIPDAPFLPLVLEAAKFAALDGKERRKVLFDLTGAGAGAAEVARRLEAKGADLAKFEKVKPLLRGGFPAAEAQAKEYAAESRGAWKAITGENYGSQKAETWEPELPPTTVTQEQIAEAAKALADLDGDLAEAQQTLGGHKANAQVAAQRQAHMAQLRETAVLLQRRQDKLGADQARVDEWTPKVAEAQRATAGQPAHDPLACPHCQGQMLMERGQLVAYVAPEKVADPEAARRLTEYQGYLQSAQRAVANSQRDVDQSRAAAEQLANLEQQAAAVPDAKAMENADQAITEIRQERDKARAKHQALVEAHGAIAGRDAAIASAAQHHADVVAWSLIAEALAPTGIPAEILAGALDPFNELLAAQAAVATWQPVVITPEIDIIYGGRLYGLLSESEKWRADTLLAIAIARLSGIRLVLLDRFDVLQPTARPQALKLLLALTRSGDLDSAVLAGTMKEPMAKVPAGTQQVWIQGGIILEAEIEAA
ncbi:AAA family ATPase [Pseudomonas oryzihabitans]|uniref:AAA family ATPase n=1 Tax=Pseudomonas oryzihabitans TaxID=47885 RepID=UPI00241DB223|nr:AAA family ATPase [Pseudomonas oryzihabitans]